MRREPLAENTGLSPSASTLHFSCVWTAAACRLGPVVRELMA
jgi:hypothetical protein